MALHSSIPGFTASSGEASLSPRPADSDGIHFTTHHKTVGGGHVLTHHHSDGTVTTHHFLPHEHGVMVGHFARHTA
jgi:hypothetical protein